MNETLTNIIKEIKELEDKLEKEMLLQEDKLSYKIKEGKIKFDKDAIAKQKENLNNLFLFFKEMPALHLITSPIIYIMIVPIIILDILLFIYQQSISRVYKLPKIKRSDYVVFDRHLLAYLNIIEKINCMYCSYFNGILAYASQIAAETELYFCPIKHAKKTAYKHSKYNIFFAYGDSEGYGKKLEDLRETLKDR